MKVYLKKDWDYPPSYKKGGQGHFVGRNREKSLLVDELHRKNSGSILVSGLRGVGKTSLVYESIKEASLVVPNLIPIVVNASQLELYSHDVNFEKDLPEIIIKNLIRRLYGHFQASPENILDESTQQDMAGLYKKAVASIFEEKLSSVDESALEKEEERNVTTESKFQISIPNKVKNIVSSTLLVLGGVGISSSGLFWKVIGILLLAASWLAWSLDIQRVGKKIGKALNRKRSVEIAESLYKKDASLGNLEYELNNLLEKLWSKGVKIVFVIDELDKIEGTSSEQVFGIIRTYKNLFTLSYALFVFITSNSVFELVTNARDKRTSEYTLFTNKIFIGHADFSDLEQFFAEVIQKIQVNDRSFDSLKEFEASDLEDPIKRIKDFKKYICFKARGDYFDLYAIVRDFITDYDHANSTPILDLSGFGDFDHSLYARLQEVLTQIYQRNKHLTQSEWHKNDAVILGLYKFLEENYNQSFNLRIEHKTNNQRIIVNDLIPYLERLEIIQEQKRVSLAEEPPVDAVDYQWTGKIPGQGTTPAIPSSPNVLFPEEGSFKDAGDKYAQIINDLDDLPGIIEDPETEPTKYDAEHGIVSNRDAQALTGIDAYNIFAKYEPYFESLAGNPPGHVNRKNLISYTKELIQEIGKIKSVALQIFTNLTKSDLSSESLGHSANQLQNEQDLFQPFVDFKDKVVNTNTQHIVIYNTEPMKSKQVIITTNLDPLLLTEETIRTFDQNQAFRLVNIQTDPNINLSNEYEVEYDQISYKPSSRKKKKRVTTKMKRRVPNIENIKLGDDYLVLAAPVRSIRDWFNA